jgi:hypothetical protein
MNNALSDRAIGYESLLMLFAEKVLLGAVVPLLVLLVANPMKFDRQQQISAVIALLAGGYCIARGIENGTKAQSAPAPTVIASPAQPTAAPPARPVTTTGPCSPVVTGNGNTTTANCADSPKKPAPKSDK